MAYDQTFSYLSALYKSRLLNMLSINEDIAFIISPEDDYGIDIDQILLGGEFIVNKQKITLQPYLYDYYFIPTTLTTAKLLICTEIDIKTIENSIMNDFMFDVFIFSPRTNITLNENTIPKKSEINQKGIIGNRIDSACQIVEDLFKGSENFGLGLIVPVSRDYMTTFSPNDTYAGKRLRFSVKGFSPRKDDLCGN
jgi:hypothetical protein